MTRRFFNFGHALRQLPENLGFAALAILTLALATAVFVLDAV